ncbi:MAG: alpha-hydroxy acid oxidase [Propylenella sp.]
MKRRYYRGSDPARAISIEELRQMALRRLPAFAAEFLEGGGEDEVTLAWNRDALQSLRFEPRMLIDTRARHIRTRLFEREIASPLIIAPTGHNNIFRRDGDMALARAAAAARIPFALSTMSNTRLETLAEEAGGRLWMQLYVFGEKALTEDIIRRAEDSGYEALVFTVDANVYGMREWDRRQFRAPGFLTWRGMADVLLHPRWLFDVVVPRGMPRLVNVSDFFPPEARSSSAAFAHVRKLFAGNITWETVAELRRRWPRKLLIKGILSLEDARRAAEAGCDGIVLSNHGGRHLDSCLSPMEILPEVAAELRDRLTIVVDSGFRRGSDVVKALALGAHAVMIGRATLYGLAAGGEAGVTRAIGILNSEIDRVLGQIGCTALADLGPQFLRANAASLQAGPVADSG